MGNNSAEISCAERFESISNHRESEEVLENRRKIDYLEKILKRGEDYINELKQRISDLEGGTSDEEYENELEENKELVKFINTKKSLVHPILQSMKENEEAMKKKEKIINTGELDSDVGGLGNVRSWEREFNDLWKKKKGEK